jgi:hypothetical protein
MARPGPDRGERSSGRELLEAALADPPRDTTWTVVVAAEHTEVHDASGRVVATAGRSGGAVKGSDGRLLVNFVPGVKQFFSPSNLLNSALSGVLGGSDSPQWRPGTTVEAPPLNLRFVPAGLPFAQVCAHRDGTASIELLPGGGLNDKVFARVLAPDAVARVRALSPHRYAPAATGSAELADAGGNVVAKLEADAPAGGPGAGASAAARRLEFQANELPGVWLVAILLACERWRHAR